MKNKKANYKITGIILIILILLICSLGFYFGSIKENHSHTEKTSCYDGNDNIINNITCDEVVIDEDYNLLFNLIGILCLILIPLALFIFLLFVFESLEYIQ